MAVNQSNIGCNDVLTATAKAVGKSVSGNSNSVTVQASAPSPPTVTGSYIAGNTSVSGTGGNTLVRVYVDGAPIGTATPSSGNWTLSGLATSELYRGAVIHATNVVNGIESAISNTVTVAGVVSYCITDEFGNALTDKFWSNRLILKLRQNLLQDVVLQLLPLFKVMLIYLQIKDLIHPVLLRISLMEC